MSTDSGEKIFYLNFPTQAMGDFRAFARQAARLKPYGRVLVGVSSLADRAWHLIPEGGSHWHDYASQLPSLAACVPHPKIARHLPAEWVAGNRRLLEEKAALLKEMKLEAYFTCHEPFFLPESFFQEFPSLRGPRIDHPRRSRREEFSLCVDLPETIAMYEWMASELKRAAPNLAAFTFSTNDAGAGFCWAAAQYSGPNGPRHCQSRPVGERVRAFVDAIARGAEKGGGAIHVGILTSSNFWNKELELITPFLNPGTLHYGPNCASIGIPTMFCEGYPILGLLDPLSILEAMESYGRPDTRNFAINFGDMYSRANERLDTIEKTLDIVEDAIRKPVCGLYGRLDRLRQYTAKWGGEKRAEAVAEAFIKLHEAFNLRKAVAPQFNAHYHGVSMRYMTRPLVIKPELLAGEEENYFLPYVFNIHADEARRDYIDFHGGRMKTVPIAGQFLKALAAIRGAAKVLEDAGDAPDGAWLKRLALSWKLWTGIMRSCHNFFFGQAIRDRNRDVLAGPPQIPEKAASWSGHPDLLPWNELMRDELDNCQETIALLENGGLDLVVRAKTVREEDTFILGPDVPGALKKKAQVMRAHWLDVEDYLATPHK